MGSNLYHVLTGEVLSPVNLFKIDVPGHFKGQQLAKTIKQATRFLEKQRVICNVDLTVLVSIFPSRMFAGKFPRALFTPAQFGDNFHTIFSEKR